MKQNQFSYVAHSETNKKVASSKAVSSTATKQVPIKGSAEKQKKEKPKQNINNNNNKQKPVPPPAHKPAQPKEQPENEGKRDASDSEDDEEEVIPAAQAPGPAPEEALPTGFCFSKLLNYRPFVGSKEVQDILMAKPYEIKSSIGHSSCSHPHPISASLRCCVTAWALADVMRHYKGRQNVRVASVYSSSRDQTIVDYANKNVVDGIRLEHIRPLLTNKDIGRDALDGHRWEGKACLAAFAVDVYRLGDLVDDSNNGPFSPARLCRAMEQLGLLEDFPAQSMSRPFYWIGHRFTGDAGTYEKEGAWHRVTDPKAPEEEQDVIYSKPDDTGAAYGPDPACDWIWLEKPWHSHSEKGGWLTWTVLKTIGSFSIVKFQVLRQELYSSPVSQYTPEFTRVTIKVEEDYFGSDLIRSCDPCFGYGYTTETFLLPTTLRNRLFNRPSMSQPGTWGLRVLEQAIGTELSEDPTIRLHAKLFPDLWENKLALFTSWKTNRSNRTNSRVLPVLGALTQKVIPKIRAFFLGYGQPGVAASYWKRKLLLIVGFLLLLFWLAKKFKILQFLNYIVPGSAATHILTRHPFKRLEPPPDDLHVRESDIVGDQDEGETHTFRVGTLAVPPEQTQDLNSPFYTEPNRIGMRLTVRSGWRYNLPRWTEPFANVFPDVLPEDLIPDEEEYQPPPDPPAPPIRVRSHKMMKLMVSLFHRGFPNFIRRDIAQRLPYLILKYGLVSEPEYWTGGWKTMHLLYGGLLSPFYEEWYKSLHPACAIHMPLMEFWIHCIDGRPLFGVLPLIMHGCAAYCTYEYSIWLGIWLHLCWNIGADVTSLWELKPPTVFNCPFMIGEPEPLAGNLARFLVKYGKTLWKKIWEFWFPLPSELWQDFLRTYHHNPLWPEKRVAPTDLSVAEPFSPILAKVENQRVPFTLTQKAPDPQLPVRLHSWTTDFHKEEYASTWFLLPCNVFSCSIAKTPHAMLFMVQTRILVPAPGDQFRAQILWQKLEYYIPALFPLMPVMCHDELVSPWIARFKGAKRAKYTEALLRFEKNGMESVHTAMETTELMLKTDELLIRINGEQYELKPRCIAKVSEFVQVYTGPCVDKAQHDLAAYWNPNGYLVRKRKRSGDYNITIAFACGWSPQDLNHWLAMAVACDDISHILVSGDDSVVYNCETRLWMEGDLGMCDQSQGWGPLRFERYALARLGVPDDVSRIVEQLTTAKYMVKHPDTLGRIIIRRGNRPMRDTGGVDTCIGNSIYTAVLLFAHLHLGWDFLELGADMKMRLYPTWKGVSFLKGLWYPTIDGPFWGPLPSRFLKVGKSRRHPGELYPTRCYEEASHQFLIDLAWGYSSAYPVPLLRRFVSQFKPQNACELDLFAEEWQTVLFRTPSGGFPEMVDEVWKILFDRYSLTREDFERAESLIPDAPFFFLCDPVFLAMAMKDYC